jgi:hypothetical protein
MSISCFAQEITDSSALHANDTTTLKPIDTGTSKKTYKPIRRLADSTRQPVRQPSAAKILDTARPGAVTALNKNLNDTVHPQKDSFPIGGDVKQISGNGLQSLLSANKLINVKEPAVFFIANKKKRDGKEFMFYGLCLVVLILGLFKTFYSNYFNNLFRVYFNTSIRQSQLTDQLLQGKLQSFILNIFFAVSAGFFIWLLFKYYHPPRLISNELLLPICIAGVGALYFVKYCMLKFMGWMSGMQDAADKYIFVIFLVNKIAGIILIPFIILLAFALPFWTNSVAIFALLVMGLFFLSRYIKTFGILEYRFPLQPLHFIIYIVAVEIVPLLLIYKLLVDYVI